MALQVEEKNIVPTCEITTPEDLTANLVEYSIVFRDMVMLVWDLKWSIKIGGEVLGVGITKMVRCGLLGMVIIQLISEMNMLNEMSIIRLFSIRIDSCEVYS